MTTEVKVPQLPESISDATVSTWHKQEGDSVSRDENIVDLETDKVMLEVPAPIDGVIKQIVKKTGTVVHAQEVLAIIESSKTGKKTEPTTEKPQPETKTVEPQKPIDTKPSESDQLRGPAARRAAAQQDVDRQLRKEDEKAEQKNQENGSLKVSGQEPKESKEKVSERPEKRVPMTRMRARIAERLLEVTQNTAMLTTFNEVNMSQIIALRNRYRDRFEKKYKVRLGFMSFFVKACVAALKQAPVVNASIDGSDIVYHGYYDIGVAVSTERGLVVPILRDVDQMNMADIELEIASLAEKARSGKLTLEEMQGGTFTITNGGVFGSLLATPLLNSPQSAILGMHKVEERPIVENGEIVIRPMMYVALSYDHRIIDGKESVTFLVSIKEFLEDPARMVLEL